MKNTKTKTNSEGSKKIQLAIKCILIVCMCILFSFMCTTFMLMGMASSNILFALAEGRTLTGTVTEKIEFRGTYRLLISVESYETLDYPCSQEIYQMYDIGDTVSLDVDIIIH